MRAARQGALVLGLGVRGAAEPGPVAAFVRETLDDLGLAPAAVGAVATLGTRTKHPAVLGLLARFNWDLVGLSPQALAEVEVPTPSEAVRTRTGTPSVAEAAALLAASRRGAAELVHTKRVGPGATLALAGPVAHRA